MDLHSSAANGHHKAEESLPSASPPQLPSSPIMPGFQQPKLEAALNTANKRVITAGTQIAKATTNLQAERAIVDLSYAVRHLETVAFCAKRCAMVAHELTSPLEFSGGDGEYVRKRMRLEAGTASGQSPSWPAALDSATKEPIETGDVNEVVSEERDDGL